MMPARVRSYNGTVKRGFRRGAMGSFLAFAFAICMAARAQADTTTITTGGNPIVWVQLHAGNIVVHTWDRNEVFAEVESTATVRHISGPQVAAHIPQQVPLWSQTVHLRDGDYTLPPETFVVPQPTEPVNDAVMVRGDGNVTLNVPAGTAILATNVGRGTVAIDNYHNGVVIAHVGGGALHLDNVSGTAAMQILGGPLSVVNSDFTRVRARSARGNIIFERCNVREIQATSISGSVIYDDGTFAPGLARFESQRGNVALGVASGSVQISAHSDRGEVHEGFGSDARVLRNGTETQAAIGSGGPVVTATTAGGAVLLYKGALRDSNLRTRVPAARMMLQRWQRHPPMTIVPHRPHR